MKAVWRIFVVWALWSVAVPASAQFEPGESSLFVTPDGAATGSGTETSPIDAATAFSDGNRVRPGTVVWFAEGTYQVGELRLAPGIRGTKEQPIVYRAVPGQRATLVGQIRLKNHHVWFWGLDVKGGFDLRLRGDGIKLINLTIREAGPPTKPRKRGPSGQGIGDWDAGNDVEFYGNLVYHNGWNHFDHGIYSQNTARHTVKRYIDNIVFENAGLGISIYGESPVLSGFHLEGNICFATSLMPRNPRSGEMNILVGGMKPISNVILRRNCTYHPQPDSKRGVDIGYQGAPNTGILIEENYFMGGANAMELHGVAEVTVRNNVFWAPKGMIAVDLAAGADRSKIVFANNRYIYNGKLGPKWFRTHIAVSATDRLVPTPFGRPVGLHVFHRVNQYEPQRVHLAVYNWDRQPVVTVVLKDILKAGESYRVVNVLDFFGEPVIQGKARGSSLRLPMKGHRYEPEFGAYVLFHEDARKR